MTQRSDAAGFSPRHRAIALSFAEALLPSGRRFAGAGPASIERLERNLSRIGPRALGRYAILLDALEHSTLAGHRTRFSQLPLTRRAALLEGSLEGRFLRRSLLFALALPVETAHFDAPEFFEQIDCVYRHSAASEPARWMGQVHRANQLGEEELLCDVAVIGTGAGGAVVAKELAEAGHAVVMVEEGEYRTREDFSGRPSDALETLYRQSAACYSIGNAIIPIPLGRSVGGTTTINSGTVLSYPGCGPRTLARRAGPRRVHPRAHEALLRTSGAGALRWPRPRRSTWEESARVVARGCQALGWSHHALRRNAPDCDGRGVCCFGCPTDAKRSTNVSYVPLALRALSSAGHRAARRPPLARGRRGGGDPGPRHGERAAPPHTGAGA